MPLYELKTATLENVEGAGYAFSRKTFAGKAFQGVFFTEDPAALEALKEADSVEFNGTVYDNTRERKESIPVTITNITSTRTGERADFEMVEEA